MNYDPLANSFYLTNKEFLPYKIDMHTCNDGGEEWPIIPYIGPDNSICGEH